LAVAVAVVLSSFVATRVLAQERSPSSPAPTEVSNANPAVPLTIFVYFSLTKKF